MAVGPNGPAAYLIPIVRFVMAVKFVPVVKVRFLPFDCPEYFDGEGWLVAEFRSECKAWEWARGSTGFVEDAYIVKSGHYMIRDGCIQQDG